MLRFCRAVNVAPGRGGRRDRLRDIGRPRRQEEHQAEDDGHGPAGGALRFEAASLLSAPLSHGRAALAGHAGALGHQGLKEDAGLPGDVDLG